MLFAAKAHLLAARERQVAAQLDDPAAASDMASDAQLSDRPGRRGADRGRSERQGRGDLLDRAADAQPSDRQGRRGADRGETAHYLHDVKSSKSQMRRPSESGSLSWR